MDLVSFSDYPCNCLMSLFFFPGVGVADEEVGEAEWACCFGGGDQAIDGLCLSGEGVGGCSCPGGGQCDGARGLGVGSVEPGASAARWGVVVADEGGVGVGVHAFVPGGTRRGCDEVWGVVSPVPLVVRGCQGDGDVVAQQVDGVGLCGVGGCHERGDVLVGVGHVGGALVQARAVGVDGCGGIVQDLARGGHVPGGGSGACARVVCAHEWLRLGAVRQRLCVRRRAVTQIIIGVSLRRRTRRSISCEAICIIARSDIAWYFECWILIKEELLCDGLYRTTVCIRALPIWAFISIISVCCRLTETRKKDA